MAMFTSIERYFVQRMFDMIMISDLISYNDEQIAEIRDTTSALFNEREDAAKTVNFLGLVRTSKLTISEMNTLYDIVDKYCI